MTAGLAQAQQRLERRDHAAAAREALEHLGRGRCAHGVVDGALGLREHAVQHDVGARRQLGRHLRLAAAQHERAQALAQPLRRFGLAARDRARDAFVEVATPAEQAGVQEVHLAPQLLEAVLDRRAGERDAALRVQRERRARDLAVGVLDRLRLVEHHQLPANRGELLRIEPQQRVGRERHRRAIFQLAIDAVIRVHFELRSEARDLVAPVREHARGRNDERARAEGRQRLQRLAEAHVVGEQRAEPGAAEEVKPAHAGGLITAQARSELGREGHLGQRSEVVEQCGEALEARRARLLERVAQAREIGHRARWQRAVGAPRGEQIRDQRPELREPIRGERREAAPEQRHERFARAPGAEYAGCARLSSARGPEAHRETFVAGDQLRLEPGREKELAMRIPEDLRARTLESLAKVNRIGGPEIDAMPRYQLELVREPALELALGCAIPNRNRVAERDELAPIHARGRRVAVHDRREHR